jgi:LPS sulfotransferase NodH
MSYPFIIWCRQRTGSTALFYALCAASEHTPAEIEPFDLSPSGDRQLSSVSKRMAPGDRNRALRDICDKGLLIKHCYENLPVEFNHKLAETSTRAGYRHIHLYRRDEVARLISKGIAEQHGTWGAHDGTRVKYEEWKAKGMHLPPLDVPALKRYHDTADEKWKAIGPLLRAHDVEYEELFYTPWAILARLANYINASRALHSISKMVAKLGTGQNTPAIWNLIPNVEELRDAVNGGK